jgi:mannitol/fructose-specific phosphotransferase system IIA component (Ntr-type)
MIQGLHRFLSESSIVLDLDDRLEIPEELDAMSIRARTDFKRSILKVLVESFEHSGAIVNPSKLLTDLCNREAKATTGLGSGMAFPHVRTLQARELVIAVMKSDQGIYFNSLDEKPVHVFIGMVSPPYDDKMYLKVMSSVGKAMEQGGLMDVVMNSWTPSQLMGEFCRLRL